MKYKINEFIRPSQQIIDRFSKLGTAAITDAMGRYGAMDPEIKPVQRGLKLCGPAVTIRTYRSDNLFLHVGLEAARAGDVIVADAGGVKNAGVWGDLMTVMAVHKKLAGVVIDGAVRDCADLIRSGLPIYSRHICPMGGFKEIEGAVNIPVSCGGIPVMAGDIIVGDDDGVAVVPQDQALAVLQKAELMIEKEKSVKNRIAAGETLFHILELDKKV